MGSKGLSLAVAGVMACVACSGSDAVSPQSAPRATSTLSGTYGLSSLSGLPLPQTIGADGLGAIDVLGGTIQLNADGSYLDVLTFRRRGAGGIQVIADTLRGSFFELNRVLVMNPRGGDSELASLQGPDSLGIDAYGLHFVYQRTAIGK